MNKETKTCTKCGRELGLREFSKQKGGRFGLHSQCRECRAAYSSARFEKIKANGPSVLVSEKLCTKCCKTKLAQKFSPDVTRIDGLQAWCRTCKCEFENEKNSNEDIRADKARVARERYRADKEAGRERSRKWRSENPERTKEISRGSYAKKCRFEVSLQSSKRAAKAGDYEPCNTTVEELKAAFTGRCDICGVPEMESTRKLCMDHDHMSGEFRGHLCRRCNTVLGLAGDDSGILDIASAYLRSHEAANK